MVSESGQRIASIQKPGDFHLPGIENEQNPGLESWKLNVIGGFLSITGAPSLPTYPCPTEISCQQYFYVSNFIFLPLLLFPTAVTTLWRLMCIIVVCILFNTYKLSSIIGKFKAHIYCITPYAFSYNLFSFCSHVIGLRFIHVLIPRDLVSSLLTQWQQFIHCLPGRY